MDTYQREERQHWLSVLARAEYMNLEKRWDALSMLPEYTMVRAPEIGLAQVRGRMGGAGRAFNVGDVTVTRAVIRLKTGEMGFSYVTGRNKSHAELIAVVDALMQTDARAQLNEQLIIPLAAEKRAQEEARAKEVLASKVDFFTMVRGED
ncbi:phosphonate C-P lyase system protein PhnG [Veronia pacifica]|uniref:Phosphonate C-P lyase system protein PhnG n=1 Tax=Veronia pacifica TaxID=1080227 RepID=A0A1C3EIH2_9GAMM|nr:phosphonate C-P lyase system protein PhnG [Veronia pacifica]ODA33027.1 phosphonate C-P lyase system protein PhnG [Veronia pacifica]